MREKLTINYLLISTNNKHYKKPRKGGRLKAVCVSLC